MARADEGRHDGVHAEKILLPLVLGLWGCATLASEVSKALNSTRDTVIHGLDDAGRPLTIAHRELLMHSDWLPQVIFLLAIAVGFAAIAALAGAIVLKRRLRFAAWSIAGLSLLMAILWGSTAPGDWGMMSAALSSRRQAVLSESVRTRAPTEVDQHGPAQSAAPNPVDRVTLVLAPLAAFWAAFGSLLAASKFVNGLRDTVIMGSSEGGQLSAAHRRAVRFDWILSMAGTVGAAALFAVMLLWTANIIETEVRTPSIAAAIRFVAIFPAISAVLFVACGVSDYRAMRDVVEADKPADCR